MMSNRGLDVALWLSAILNALGTAIFAQASITGASPFVPIAMPRFAAAQIGWVIALFGAVYGWQAMASRKNRALIALGGTGKIGFFLLTAVYWIVGDVPQEMAVNATPDLLLGSALLAWAVRSQSPHA